MNFRGVQIRCFVIINKSKAKGARLQNCCTFPEPHGDSEEDCRSLPYATPDFLFECSGVDEVRAALFTEIRIRGRCWICEVGNPGTLRSG